MNDNSEEIVELDEQTWLRAMYRRQSEEEAYYRDDKDKYWLRYFGYYW